MLNSNPRSVLTLKVTFKVKFKVKGRGTRCRPNLQAELRFFDVKISANHVGKCRSTFDDLDL